MEKIKEVYFYFELSIFFFFIMANMMPVTYTEERMDSIAHFVITEFLCSVGNSK